ncbi:MAG: hypothetical protein EOR16_30245 [Mesorhizobium sp.]|uniref:hypothetical protein n=1 Tax=Mesorhizobium sp. TaxID=1871066 RepID=UPI000FE48FC6|nr:hypothetical protein [Mesorhizobium sp.]RWI50540.1 MAG: hypothetical protein EOR16_30245 [Mesorhizobium sp.]
MRHLDAAAGASAFCDVDDTFEMRLGQVPLAEPRAGGRRVPKADRILIVNRMGDQRAQDTELLDFRTTIAFWRRMERIDRPSASRLEAAQQQKRQRAAEILQDASRCAKKMDCPIEGDGIAGLFGGDRQMADAGGAAAEHCGPPPQREWRDDVRGGGAP